MSLDLASYSSSLGCSKHHISFIPKYRHKIFVFRQIKAVCEQLFHQIAKKYNFRIIELDFDIDHIHMVISLPPYLSIAKAIQLLKGISARKLFKAFPWLRTKFFWGGNLWSGAYYFDSVGRTTTEAMQQYVKNQGSKGDQKRLNHFMPPTSVGGC